MAVCLAATEADPADENTPLPPFPPSPLPPSPAIVSALRFLQPVGARVSTKRHYEKSHVARY